jgi:aspartokinase
VALEEHLASIILTRREDVERTSHHSKHDAAEQLFADAMIAWKTATETALIVDADMKRPLQRRLNRERYTIKEGLPLTAISVIVRKMKTESFNPLLISAVTRSLRQFQVYALLPIEQSIVILVDEREGKAALKKLHHDLFET